MLEPELRAIVEPVLGRAQAAPGILRPDLSKGESFLWALFSSREGKKTAELLIIVDAGDFRKGENFLWALFERARRRQTF